MARRGLFIIVALKNLQRVGALLVIIAATFLVYWPAQRNEFVWDDTALVQRDPLIRSWRLIPEGFQALPLPRCHGLELLSAAPEA
jgi:hypothetical protein